MINIEKYSEEYTERLRTLILGEGIEDDLPMEIIIKTAKESYEAGFRAAIYDIQDYLLNCFKEKGGKDES